MTVAPPPRAVAFLCLGAMGAPMARHLGRAGHVLTVYNRTPPRAEAFVRAHGGRWASSPAAAARGAEVVLACTGNDDDLRAITSGPDGAFAGMQPGAVFVDHTSVSPGLARALAREAGARGLAFLDAPVSGGQSGAEEGALTIMVGGSAAVLEGVRPLLDLYAKRVVHVGDAGAGQCAKLVNQICIAGLVQALAEGLAFARRAGLDTERLLDAISQGAAQSWQMDHRARTMLEGRFDFGFAVDWMRKDLANALAEARQHGASLPVTEQVDALYAQLQARGEGRLDTSSLIRLLG